MLPYVLRYRPNHLYKSVPPSAYISEFQKHLFDALVMQSLVTHHLNLATLQMAMSPTLRIADMQWYFNHRNLCFLYLKWAILQLTTDSIMQY